MAKAAFFCLLAVLIVEDSPQGPYSSY